MGVSSEDSSRQASNVSWLIRLRWGACAGQVVTVIAANYALSLGLSLLPLLTLIGVAAFSNLALQLWSRRREASNRLVGGVLAGDIVVLSILLFFSGGPLNPFNFVYLIYIALASVVLPQGYGWTLSALAMASFGVLFFVDSPLAQHGHHHGHDATMQMHLKGMWVAFAVAAIFIVYFISRITQALAMREEQIRDQRERILKSERLASLATLAAGAAHELSTPLSTIALVATELEKALSHAELTKHAQDAQLIREQCDRCRMILSNMNADAGQSLGEASETHSLKRLVAAVQDGITSELNLALTLRGTGAVEVPLQAMAQALRALINNGHDASPDGATVKLSVDREQNLFLFRIEDKGKGMTAEQLSHAGEPFFTTKPAGKGMGLGLFLARALIEQCGGTLSLSSQLGKGTQVLVQLPVAATNDRLVIAAPSTKLEAAL